MLLRIATTASPATDLGFLLHKHPDRLQEVELPYGIARVAYTEASEARCEAMLSVEVAHDRADVADGVPFVSDRPYVAGSLMSTAISKAFGTAMTGRCDQRPEMAAAAIPLEIMVTPAANTSLHGVGALFEPLGWQVEDEALPLDSEEPAWGSVHHRITLRGTLRLCDALRHLCVLLPVMDGRSHVFLTEDQIGRLARLGDGWLEAHPLGRHITRRFLHFGELIRANERLRVKAESDVAPAARAPSLQQSRIATAMDYLVASRAESVLDLGCGEGDLLAAMLDVPQFRRITGVDPSVHSLNRASKRLRLERLPPAQRERVTLLQGAATYPDGRIGAFDAVTLLEVIEHLEPDRLAVMERNVFEVIGPRVVIVTTPNHEWNASQPGLANGRLRHGDHRFEWARGGLRTWADRMGERYGYGMNFFHVGQDVDAVGAPTQGVVFTRTTP